MIRRPPRSPLFPYTTLVRSARASRYGASGVTVLVLGERGAGCTELIGALVGRPRLLPLPPPSAPVVVTVRSASRDRDRKSTRLNSSHANISYAVFCLKKKNK